jgi:hypothetical protein
MILISLVIGCVKRMYNLIVCASRVRIAYNARTAQGIHV